MVTAMSDTLPDRRAVVAALLANRADTLVVSGLGSATYDVHAAGDHDANFYLWGAMGGAALIGLGLAQAQPSRRILVITGDGEQLMAFGSLATIAVAKPRNLTIVVIDNQHFGETGMQSSHTGLGIDLARVAQSCGFAATSTIDTMAQTDSLAARLHALPDAPGHDGSAENLALPGGPQLHVIKVTAQNPPRSLPVRDAVFIRNRFRRVLGLQPN